MEEKTQKIALAFGLESSCIIIRARTINREGQEPTERPELPVSVALPWHQTCVLNRPFWLTSLQPLDWDWDTLHIEIHPVLRCEIQV